MFTWMILTLALGAETGQSLQLTIQAGRFDRAGVPISCELPEGALDWPACSLFAMETGKPVPCQMVKESKPRLVFMLEEPLLAGKVRQYRLKKADSPRDAEHPHPVKVARVDRALSITLNDKPVLVYND